MATKTKFRGSYTALVTPFKNGSVDETAFRSLVSWQIDEGSHGLVPVGTTGESPTLDDGEREAIVERTIGVVAGQVPIYVGIGGNSTAKTVKQIKQLERYDFTGIVSVCPYYNRPGQDGLLPEAGYRRLRRAGEPSGWWACRTRHRTWQRSSGWRCSSCSASASACRTRGRTSTRP